MSRPDFWQSQDCIAGPNNAMEWDCEHPRLTVDPDVCHGQACVKGTCVMVVFFQRTRWSTLVSKIRSQSTHRGWKPLPQYSDLCLGRVLTRKVKPSSIFPYQKVLLSLIFGVLPGRPFRSKVSLFHRPPSSGSHFRA